MTGQREDVPGEEEGPLVRWSRRKAAVRAGVVPAEPAPAANPADRLPATVAPAESETANIDTAAPADTAALATVTDPPAPLPALDTLDEDSDYSAFLHEKVPDLLRRKALKQLFASAKFNIVDGLDDYDDDFRAILPLGDIVTSDMRHRAEVEAERAREAAQAQAQGSEQAEAEHLDEDEPALTEQDEAALTHDTDEPAAELSDEVEPSAGGEPSAGREPSARGEPPAGHGEGDQADTQAAPRS